MFSGTVLLESVEFDGDGTFHDFSGFVFVIGVFGEGGALEEEAG